MSRINRKVLEIDRFRIETGEGSASSYVVVERGSGYCWNAAVTKPEDVAGALTILREALEKLRATIPGQAVVEICHDGAEIFAHPDFVRGMRDLAVARVVVAGRPQAVTTAERAFWEMRAHFARRDS